MGKKKLRAGTERVGERAFLPLQLGVGKVLRVGRVVRGRNGQKTAGRSLMRGVAKRLCAPGCLFYPALFTFLFSFFSIKWDFLVTRFPPLFLFCYCAVL